MSKVNYVLRIVHKFDNDIDKFLSLISMLYT